MTDYGDIIQLIETEMGLNTDSVGIISVASAITKHLKPDEIKYSDFSNLMRDNSRLQDLLNELTVAETWFFRDTECFNYLRNELFQNKYKYTSENKLRILSAPCSTGEEPYSIAILLNELGFKSTDYEIIASDLNPNSLNKAKIGIFGKSSFRNDYHDFKAKYFNLINENCYELNYKIKSIPTFKKGNLVKSNFLQNESKFDYVFCKNLLIYLHDDARRQVLENISRLLKPDGILFAGLSETAYFTRNNFTYIKHDMAFACRQITLSEPDEVKLLKTQRLSDKPLAETISERQPVKSHRKVVHSQNQDANNQNLYQKLHELADKGHYSEAEKICTDLLSKDISDYSALYIMGLIKNASGKSSEAKDFFNKVLYIKPDHYESLIHTSLIYESTGEHELASIYRERAERIFIKMQNKAK